jgi:hypothetical protein
MKFLICIVLFFGLGYYLGSHKEVNVKKQVQVRAERVAHAVLAEVK